MNSYLNTLRRFFAPPVFEEDEEKTRAAELVNTILISLAFLFFVALAGILLVGRGQFTRPLIAIVVLVVLMLVLQIPLRRGFVRPVSITIVVFLSLALFVTLPTTGTIRGVAVGILIFTAIIAGLTIGRGTAYLVTAINILFVTGMVYAEANGFLPEPDHQVSIQHVVSFSVAAIMSVILIDQALRRIESVVDKLTELNTGLEQRVAERTKALSSVAEVGIAASTILETDKLLQQVVNLAKEHFNFYHAHIYLLNEAGDTLVLSSGAGKVGRQMVAEGRSIPLDREQSLVARAAREKKGVTVNDVTTAPDFLPNPLLPDTHSEMAVPMMVGDQVIGVFDVQSEIVGRFRDADIAVQTTLASQVASAVQNARSYTKAKEAEQLTRTIIDATTDAIFIKDRQHRYILVNEGYASPLHMPASELIGKDDLELGYPEDIVRGNPQKGIRGFWTDDNLVFETGKTQHYPNDPIIVDGNVHILDTLKIPLRNAEGHIWAVLGFSRDVTEREHLHELTAQRARQQEAINRITQKIESTITIEDALQVVARELGHALGLAQTFVSLDLEAINSTDQN